VCARNFASFPFPPEKGFFRSLAGDFCRPPDLSLQALGPGVSSFRSLPSPLNTFLSSGLALRIGYDGYPVSETYFSLGSIARGTFKLPYRLC